MKSKLLLILFLLPFTVVARPTSNVINAIYSLSDDFFEQYNFPKIPFRDRVLICESLNSVYYDSTVVGAGMLQDGKTMWLYSESEGGEVVNHLYFKLIKDKAKKRQLLFVFHQISKRTVHLERIDVFQFDKKAENRWKTINASGVLPKLSWSDLYQGISENALNTIFTMRPALEVQFFPNGIILLNIAYDYIELHLPKVHTYLNTEAVDANQIQLEWVKKHSRYIPKIE